MPPDPPNLNGPTPYEKAGFAGDSTLNF